MSDDPIILAVLLLVTSCVYALAGYRAFRMRKALVGSVYRSRALWAFVFAILFIPFVFAILPFNYGAGSPNWEVITAAIFVVAFNLVAFVFCDRTIMVVREMDFFHRDTLAYGKVRWFVWITSAVGMFGSLFGPSTGILSDLFFVLWPAPLAFFALALAATSFRVSDRAIRNYSKWFGLFTGMLAISFLVLNTGEVSITAGMFIASLLYYRSTVSLSTTSRLDLTADTASVSPPESPGERSPRPLT